MKGNDDIIYLKSNINELFATTDLTQYFTNKLDKPIELTVVFPIKEEINLSKFVVSLDDKIVISKVMPKEKAEEKYNDTIASGNVGFYSSYHDNDNSYSVNIGNLKPNQQIKLNSIFIQMIGTQDMSYEFNIMEKYPTFYYKELNKDKPHNKTINAEFKIKTQSKLTRLIAPFYDDEAKKNSSYEVQYSQDYKEAKIKYIKNPDNIKNSNYNNIYLSKVNAPTYYSSFCILFRTENMNKPILYYQYNPELKESYYSINYCYNSKNLKEIPIPVKPDEDNKISYTSRYEDNTINETPGLFVFLVDQSGSMSGKSIELVKQALLLFIQSLPANSYFQLIGFGSNFQKYNKEPVIYNKENVQNIINIINDLKANLGGTNISSPLSDIYRDNIYSKINLSKNIFLLTDGQVDNREECINLITTNSSKFRVHALGIGNDFDKILIERCGKIGKGSSSFVQNVEKINSVVIDTLNKCLRPYITDIKFDFENYKEQLSNKIISCNPINNFTYQNEIMNYSFILPNKQELKDLKFKLTGKDPINIIESEIILENEIKINDGEEMGKMIVGKALKNNEELINDEKKEIEFAKKYQILSKNTALFAEIITNNNENQKTEMIKVNLNEKKNNNNYYNYNNNMFYNNNNNNFSLGFDSSISYRKSSRPNTKIMSKCYAAAPKAKKSLGFNFGSIFNSLSFSKKESKVRYRKKEIEHNVIPAKRKISSTASSNPMSSQIKKNETKDFTSNIIMSQDVIEGSWDENNETKKIIQIVTSNIFDKIKNNVKKVYQGTNEIKIIYTVLVIYYLNTKCAQRLNELKLVINKANKFLEKNGINYSNIISGI